MEILKNNLSNRLILILSVLFLLSISLAGVNAAETNINSTADLGQTIINANNGDAINLDNGTYTNNVTNIIINKNLTIQGKDPKTTIIDAQQLGRIFTVTQGNTLTLINITITNGNATYGGTIDNGGTLKITNCIFTNNNASDGGAINNFGNAIIIDSNFINNKVSDSYGYASGGAISNYDYMSIINCNFTNNTADYGGAISAGGITSIIGSNFNSNSAKEGGAIEHAHGSMSIADCSFINNSAIKGGAIIITNSTDMTINTTQFKNNHAVNGSAIYKEPYHYYAYANLTVSDSNFTDNTGGASIYLTGTNTTITSSNIFNNSQGIQIADDSDAIINYNRIFNNTNNTGFNLDDGGIGSDLDFNWWGDNHPKLNGTLNNYFVMNVTNLTSLDSNGTVKFQYTFKLNNNDPFNASLLPYFVTDVYTNVTNGVIESFDARFDRTFDITLYHNGSILYTFVDDNEVQTLEGTITIPPTPTPNPTPTPTPEPVTNQTSNNSTASAVMNETGIPIVILLVLLSLLGFGYYRKQ